MAEQQHRAVSRALRTRQHERAEEEARFARESTEAAETRAHERRAEKAAYLRDKLAEAERATRDG